MFELADYLRVIPGHKLSPRSFDRMVPTTLSQLTTRVHTSTSTTTIAHGKGNRCDSVCLDFSHWSNWD